MTNKIEIQKRIEKVAGYLENGKTCSEIIRLCTTEYKVSERTAERYIAYSRDIVMDRMEDKNAMIEIMRGEIIADEAEQYLRSNLELEAKLISIIEGELRTEKLISGSDGKTSEIKQPPSYSTILKAIDMIWKKRGAYRQPKVLEKNSTQNLMPTIVVENEEAKKVVETIMNLP